MSERKRELNRLSAWIILLLSVTALLTVLSGYAGPPQADEGTAAHIFQLSIVALVPAIAFFVATAEWSEPLRSAKPLVFPAIAVVLAFGALYYLENYRNPEYRRHSELAPGPDSPNPSARIQSRT